MHTLQAFVGHLPSETRLTRKALCNLLKNKDKNISLFSVQSKKNPYGEAI
jgi:hypothetical protein